MDQNRTNAINAMKNTNEPEEVKIEKGIPMPQGRQKSGRLTAAILGMEVGDSVLVHSLSAVMGLHHAAHLRGMKVTARVQPDGQHRVWRIK